LVGFIESHLLINKFSHIGERGGQELIRELDIDISLAIFFINVDFLKYLLSQKVLKMQLSTTLIHQPAIPFTQIKISALKIAIDYHDCLEDQQLHLIFMVDLLQICSIGYLSLLYRF
jgi:hypothetical protein